MDKTNFTELFKRKEKTDYEIIETKIKNKITTTLNKRYLFYNNKINGCIFYFSYRHSIQKQKDFIKDLLYNEDIKSFNKVVESFYKVRDKIKEHYKQSNKKNMRKDNRIFKKIAIKKILRYFNNKPKTKIQTPLKANEIRLVLNLFFDFNIGLNFFSVAGLHNIIKEITTEKIKTTTKERKQKQILKNNLLGDLYELNAKTIKFNNGNKAIGIKTFNRIKVIQQLKSNMVTLKAVNRKDSKNINKEMEHIKNRIATLRKQRIEIPLKAIEKVKNRDFNKCFVVYPCSKYDLKDSGMAFKREFVRGYIY